MSKIYFSIAEAPVRFTVKEGGVESFKDIHTEDEIIVNGEKISFPNSRATTHTKFSEVEKYFKRYHSPGEYKEMKEFKKQASIAAMQALIQRQDDTAEHITELAMVYAESLTDKMFE